MIASVKSRAVIGHRVNGSYTSLIVKRIGVVTTVDAPWGGSEELWSRAAEQLLRRDVFVAANVLAFPRPADQLENLCREGCQITQRRRGNRLSGGLRKLFDAWTQRWLDRTEPDLVIISQAVYTDGTSWMEACHHRGIPYITVAHNAGAQFWLADAASQRLALGLEQAAACYFVSQGNLDLVRRQLATPLPRAKVIRNPFNVSYDANPKWPDNKGVWRLACVGRLDAFAKGQDTLIEVLALPQWRTRPIEIRLYGDGPNRATLAALAKLRQVENVHQMGWTKDVEAIWSDNHALIMASRFEGLPLALVEAMLCGRPSIVPDVAGIAELIRDNVTGFLAFAPTVKGMNAALERAWQRRDQWQAIGQAAGHEIRQLVPRDPVSLFVDEILKYLP